MLHLYQLYKNFKQDLARESGHFLQNFAGILQNPARAFQDLARESGHFMQELAGLLQDRFCWVSLGQF